MLIISYIRYLLCENLKNCSHKEGVREVTSKTRMSSLCEMFSLPK